MPADLLGALVAYLKNSTTLATAMGGTAVVYSTMPVDSVTPPFVLVEGYEETLPGPTADDEPIELVIGIFAGSEDAAKNLAPILHTVVDSPAINPNSLRPNQLTWTNGTEVCCRRNNTGKAQRVPGFVQNQYVWHIPTSYEFWVDEVQ